VAAVLAGAVVVLTLATSALTVSTNGASWPLYVFGALALATCIVGTVWGVRGLSEHGGGRRRDLIRAGVIIAAGFAFWLMVAETTEIYAGIPAGPVVTFALVCLPTTAFGLWVLRRLDRNEKEPWRLMLVAVVWGAIIATTLALWGNGLWQALISDNLPPGPATSQSIGFSAGIIEEISKGIAVLLLYLVMRNEFDDVVDGIIYGAAVGLGFDYFETILYMTRIYVEIDAQTGSTVAANLGASFQFVMRQGISLFTGHATYTAMIGAGIGIARQMPRLHQRLLVIVAGFLAAIAAHMVWDAWISASAAGGENVGLVLLFTVFREAAGNGIFTAIVLLLLGMGLRAEGRALEVHLAAEAATGRGAVREDDIRLLTHPWRRFLERFDALTQRGIGAWVRVSRLRNAQLDLAMERWHRARRELDEPMQAEEELRQRVLRLRAAAAPPPPRWPPPPQTQAQRR
jgi:RsiW-degrading membrane proteinase PrsW (M82 family)